MRNIILIGNAPIEDSIAAKVEAADAVVRFNFPKHDPALVSARTDYLFAINSYRHTKRFMSRGLLQSPFFLAAKKMVLPWAPLTLATKHPKPRHPVKDFVYRRKYDNTYLAIDTYTRHGKYVEVLSSRLNDVCYARLSFTVDEYARLIPSTGFVALQYMLDIYPDAHIDMFGFTWQGWEGHPWQRERAWIEAQEQIAVYMP